jgi:hypothetical protein
MKVCNSNLIVGLLILLKISAQIVNNFLKNGKMKNNLIYAKSV